MHTFSAEFCKQFDYRSANAAAAACHQCRLLIEVKRGHVGPREKGLCQISNNGRNEEAPRTGNDRGLHF